MPCLGSSQHQHDGPPASAEVADDDHGVPLASAETIELGAPHLTSGNGLCPEPPLGTLEAKYRCGARNGRSIRTSRCPRSTSR
jgi:hypothetical protein